MKNYRVEFSDTAEENLLGIVDYIALDNPVRAVSFVKELTSSLKNTLSIFPYSGRLAEDFELKEEIRIIPYGNYISYYRIHEDNQVVEILFIFNASRDIGRFLKDL